MCYEIYITITYELIDGIRSYKLPNLQTGLRSQNSDPLLLNVVYKIVGKNHLNCIELARAILARKYMMMTTMTTMIMNLQ